MLSKLRDGALAGAKSLNLDGLGLREVPREVFDLADSLEVLSLSQNQITALPADFGRLTKLRILFGSANPFDHVPEVIADCPNLSMVGFKACQIKRVSSEAFQPFLRWLILTDNQIQELPAAIGRCRSMQKLMLSGNQLSSLPEELAACENLELLRLAANRFESLPEWLLNMPRLAWLAIAGNPLARPETSDQIAKIGWPNLEVTEKIGEGASGVIHRANLRNGEKTMPVAVKIFKGTVTSDGLPECEMAACIAAGNHENLIGVLGKISEHPENAEGLVMPLVGVDFTTLAGPPDFETCTRDVYDREARYSLPVILRIARGVASAAAHLHARKLIHGDLYAHNVLINSQGNSLLGDFGAATTYSPLLSQLEQIEVRAFGILLEELLSRAAGEVPAKLWQIKDLCTGPDVAQRPLFASIVEELNACNLATSGT